ncbi:hypothetical protein FEE96_03750 [Parasedimentitalea maritima]|uniref:Outer membrane protein beta-barrel domain-containing protein n=1 Tax=Parasedimentitalea maritima TaxID=2578117 RepID=A0ABY2UXQ3_9RHOB|nr:hypothetical protein [Zongyanglinia marina]TLP67658.1 hypothetical protein FEE96_03750 [Zongyanglinia marina]
MPQKTTNLLTGPILIAAATSFLSVDSLAAQDSWDFVIAPYLLAPSISGTSTLGRLGGDISVDPGDVFRNMEAGGMLRFEGRHQTGYGFALDYAFMNLGNGATSPIGDIRADYKQSIFEAVATYRFGNDSDTFDAYAGVRHWDIDVNLDILTGPAAGNLQRGDNWTDPIVGLRWQRRLNPKWRVLMQGDLGGFGVGSDFTWNLMGGFAYDRWQNTSLFMTYRALGVDYKSGTPGTPSFFEYDTVTQGLLAGVGFRF